MKTPQHVAQLLITHDLKAFATLRCQRTAIQLNHFSTVTEMLTFLKNPNFSSNYVVLDLIYVPFLDEEDGVSFKTFTMSSFIKEYDNVDS